MTLQTLSAGMLKTLLGPFFKVGSTPSGETLRHPNRVRIGEGYDHNNGLEGDITGGSFLQSYPSPGLINPVTELDYIEDLARVTITSNYGLGLAVAVQTIGGAFNGQALNTVLVNNRPAGPPGWGWYNDVQKAHASAGDTKGYETQITNLPGPSPQGGLTPYKELIDGKVIGFSTAAGSDAVVVGRSFAVDAVWCINQNGGAFSNGIVFRFDALMRESAPRVPMADDRTKPGNNGYAHAISLAVEQGISFYSQNPATLGGTDQQDVVRFYSDVVDAGKRHVLYFNDNALIYGEQEGTGSPLMQVDYIGNAASYLRVTPGATGKGVTLSAEGVAANVPLILNPKGVAPIFTDLSKVQDHASDAAAAAAGLSVGSWYRTGNNLKIRSV